MSWEIQTVAEPCKGCGLPIYPGEPARLLTKRTGRFCWMCARTRLMETAPKDMPTQEAKPSRVYVGDGRSVAPGFSGFNRAETAGTVRKAIREQRGIDPVDARRVGSE